MARSKETKKPAGEDLVFVHGRSEDGSALAVVRKKGDAISAGILKRADEGKAIHGELLRLSPREDMPLLCDVEVLHDASPPTDGPARVSTPAYRAGWDSIWGRDSASARARRSPSSLPN